MKTEIILKRLRVFLLGFSIFIFAGALVELLALKHYREDLQWLPLFLCSLGIVLTAIFLAKPGRNILKLLRIGMWIIAAGGLIGTLIHVTGNLEHGFGGGGAGLLGLFYAVAGGREPLLAPGILIIAAAMSLAAVYHHPVGEAANKK